jgi:hypothetical protein
MEMVFIATACLIRRNFPHLPVAGLKGGSKSGLWVNGSVFAIPLSAEIHYRLIGSFPQLNLLPFEDRVCDYAELPLETFASRSDVFVDGRYGVQGAVEASVPPSTPAFAILSTESRGPCAN